MDFHYFVTRQPIKSPNSSHVSLITNQNKLEERLEKDMTSTYVKSIHYHLKIFVPLVNTIVTFSECISTMFVLSSNIVKLETWYQVQQIQYLC